MDLDKIRRYTNSIADKFRTGKTLTEQQFNDFIDVVNMELFNKEYNKLANLSSDQNVPLYQILLNSTSLKEFKVYGYDISLTSGIGSLPTDYRHYLSVKTSGGVSKIRDVDVISDMEFNLIINSVLFNDLSENPKGVIYDKEIKVVPNSIPNLDFNYLKVPVTPFYDYCVVTATNQVVYMPPGYFISGGDLYDLDPLGIPILTGVTHLIYGSSYHESDSVELEWREDMHPIFSNMILEKMGIKFKDGELYQMITAEEKKGK